MDTILELPMSLVLENVPVDQEIKSLLLGGASPLRPFYQLVLAQECGEWSVIGRLASELQIAESEVAEKYWDATRWAQDVSGE
jgi:EAL and modified HD-GYP domain-containing signal transduction protein